MSEPKRKRSDGLETIDRIVSFAATELDEVGPVQFNVIRVLEKAGVSRSSVYHHFRNREGLIAAVEVQRLLEQLTVTNKTTREFVSQAESAEVILGAIETVLKIAGSEDGKQNRRRRIATMAAAQTIPVLAASIADTQMRGDEYMAGTLQVAVDKGLIAPTESLLGIAQWIGSLALGRATVDLATDVGGDEQWLSATMFSLRALLKPMK